MQHDEDEGSLSSSSDDVAKWVLEHRRKKPTELTDLAEESRKKRRKALPVAEVPEVVLALKSKLELDRGQETTVILRDRHVLDDEGDDELDEFQDIRSTGPKHPGKRPVEDRGYKSIAAAELGSEGGIGEPLPIDEETFVMAPMAAAPAAKKFKSAPGAKVQSHMRGRGQVDWGSLLEAAAPKEEEAASVGVASSKEEAMVRPEAWATAGEGEDEEESEFQALYSALDRTAAASNNRGAAAAEVKPEVQVKRELDEEMIRGVVDVKPLSGGMSLSSTSEFAKSVMTPLEKFEEKRQDRKRFLIGESSAATKSMATNNTITDFVDLPELPEDGNLITDVLEQAPIDGGLASAIAYAKQKGELEVERWAVDQGGRCKQLLTRGTDDDDVKIDYTDDYGNTMNSSQAFRFMSHKFHGKESGPAKKEKQLRRLEQAHRLRSGDPHEVMPTLRALRVAQSKGQAHLVLSGTTNPQR